MVRRVVSVVALLPLLLPPGVCVCHAPTAACAAGAARQSDDRNGLLAHLCPGHSGHEHDAPHGHVPGCPALEGLGHWVARPGTAVESAPLAFLSVPLEGAALPALATAPPHLRSAVEPPPLCLNQRPLLI
jgi:hypothetical protein